MADSASFDITTGCDLQEVDNAVNQAHKELTQRYDFRNIEFTLSFDRAHDKISLAAPDSYKLAAIFEVMQAKLIKRGVPIKNLDAQKEEAATGGSLRQDYLLKQVISTEVGKEIVKFVKEQKLKKVQASIQKDQVRVTSPSRDDLQEAITRLKAHDFGIALTFGNYR